MGRFTAALAGLVLLTAGIAGLLAGSGVLGAGAADGPVLPAWLAGAVARAPRVPVCLLAGLAALLLMLSGWVLLARRGTRAATPPAPAFGDLDLTRPPAGRTVVRGPAVVGGLERDLARIDGVTAAMVGLSGDRDRPRLRAELAVEPGTEVAKVRADVHTALDRLTATTGLEPVAAEITFRPEG
jgi:hypothetical protein